MKRVAMVAFVAALYLPALGNSSSGTHPDESYYLGISAEMDANGAWLTPTIDGEPKWFKPPLLYWAERGAYAVFGRGFLAGRLPAALCAIALAFVTGALARRMYGEEAGTIATLLVATTFGFLKFGRMAMMDAPMALAFTAAAYGAWRAAEEDRPAQLLWAGVGAGAAFMLKGPVGAVIVLLLAGGFLALRRPSLLGSRWTALTFLLGAAIGLPWYVASWVVHGRRFYDFFVIEQNVDRFRHPWTLQGEAVLIVGFLAFLLPWTALVAGALPSPRRWRDPQLLLPVLWIGAVLLVFTMPSLKWPHYGLACAPAAALLAARAPPSRWPRRVTVALLAVTSLLVLAALRWPLPRPAAVALAIGGAAMLAAAALVGSQRLAGGIVAAGIGLAVLLAVAIPAVNPPVIPPAQLARLQGRDLYVYDFVPGIFTLGAGRPVHRVEAGQVLAALERGGVVIGTAPALARLPDPVRARLAALAWWRHIPGELPVTKVIRAWRARDTGALFEPMLAVGLDDAKPTASTLPR